MMETGCPGQEVVCELCGSKLVWQHPDIPGVFLASSDYINSTICRSCMGEHCAQTNCLQCEYGVWPDCPYHWLKDEEAHRYG